MLIAAIALTTALRTPIAHPRPITTAPARIAAKARERIDLSRKRRQVPLKPMRYLGTFITTAYSYSYADSGAGDNDTCRNGMRVGVGRVAVDPHVIPLNKRIIVEGYNDGKPCVAADTGSKIHGNRIDVFVPTARAMDAWGVRTVRVWLLTD